MHTILSLHASEPRQKQQIYDKLTFFTTIRHYSPVRPRCSSAIDQLVHAFLQLTVR